MVVEEENESKGEATREGRIPVATAKFSWEDLLGRSLLVSFATQKPTTDLLQGKAFVLLYFSAHWCPPCQAFTPKLREFYKSTHRSQRLEIVYVSSDRSLKEFHDYYGTQMPWLALSTDDAATQIKQKLSEMMKVKSIPTLIVLDAEGKFVTDQGRQQVMACTDPSALVEEWKSTPSVPIADAQFGKSGQSMTLGSALKQMIIHILKNPIYVLGLVYLFKFYSRKFSPRPTEPGDDAVDDVHRNEDSEF